MKTTLLLIRHGESLGNATQVFLGHTDLGLSQKGEAQAALLTKALADRKIDAFYASDLSRAYQTVAAAAAARGLPITKLPALREVNAGIWEGMKYAAIAERYPEGWRLWMQDIGAAEPPEGENVAQLQARFLACLDQIVAENPGRVVCIGTHATTIRTACARCMGVPIRALREVPWVSNASITEVVYEDGVPCLVALGRDEHLGELCTHFGDEVKLK